MKNFILIGAAGFIAPRHMKAIKDTGNKLIAAFDPVDSVGVIDSYFPEADFFTEYERFDRYLHKQQRDGVSIDYVSICSPNYLHDAHVRLGLRYGADVICEKPIVLNPWNIDALAEIEKESGQSIYNILQLRVHESISGLKAEIDSGPADKVYDVNLTYQTSRGNWYYTSWKGDTSKSGGIATNIGVHFFDMLSWIFGDLVSNEVHLHTHDRASGYLVLERARVKWFLSINEETLKPEVRERGLRTFRSITVDDKEIEFSGGFTELHTDSYQKIIDGQGFGIEDARKAIEIAYQIRNADPTGVKDNSHHFASMELTKHPFQKS